MSGTWESEHLCVSMEEYVMFVPIFTRWRSSTFFFFFLFLEFESNISKMNDNINKNIGKWENYWNFVVLRNNFYKFKYKLIQSFIKSLMLHIKNFLIMKIDKNLKRKNAPTSLLFLPPSSSLSFLLFLFLLLPPILSILSILPLPPYYFIKRSNTNFSIRFTREKK